MQHGHSGCEDTDPPPVQRDLESLIDDLGSTISATETMAVDRQKQCMSVFLQTKVDNLAIRLQIIRLKYDLYRAKLDRFNIAIICISTMVAVTEATKSQFQLNDKDRVAQWVYHLFQMVPLLASSVTGFLAAIIKFRKFTERMEQLGRAVEKTIGTRAHLLHLIDTITQAQTMVELDTLKKTVAEVSTLLNETLTMISMSLKYQDIVRHMPTYHEMTLSYIKNERSFQEKSATLMAGSELHLLDVPIFPDEEGKGTRNHG